MKIIDSNLIIYSAQEEFFELRTLFQNSDIYISSITKVEVLGFNRLTAHDKTYFEALFRQLNQIPINNQVIDKAVEIRQMHKLSLGDAIIAATGLVFNAIILTRNISDFTRIKGCTALNPMA